MKVEDVSYAFVRQHNKANHDKFEVDVFVASFFASRMIFGEVDFRQSHFIWQSRLIFGNRLSVARHNATNPYDFI